MEHKVNFRLVKVFNSYRKEFEIHVIRDGLSIQRFAMAKKDICLVAFVANTLSCQFDNANLADGESVEFKLKMKINRK